MRRFVLGFVAGMSALVSMGAIHLPGLSDTYLRQEEMLTPTVKVELEEESGSGTVIRSDKVGTYIVTNAHVGQALGMPVKIHTWFYKRGKSTDDNVQEGRVVAIDKGADLALIKLNDLSFHVPVIAHLAPADVTLEEAEDVWVAGAALGMRVHLTQGLLSIVNLVGRGFNGPHIVTSAPVISGNSGGGLYHRDDLGHFEYIGTVQAVAVASNAPITTTNYAIPNSTLRTFFALRGYGWLLNEEGQS